MAIQARELTKDYQFGFHDEDISVFRTKKGLSAEVVASISQHKNEPEWMLKFRLKALDHFLKRPMPTWGADLSGIDFDNIYYYVKPVEEQSRSWDDVPESIKNTFDRLGIPEAERKFLAGVSAQYDSEVVYHNIREDLEKQGVLFSDCDTGLREHEDIFRKYFGRVVRVHPEGAARRHPSAGILPHQQRQHGSVRADADHRRGRFVGPLHRGLHGAQLLQRLAAQRSGGADRAPERAHPLHDDPELVGQRLQPGDQARDRARRIHR